MSNEGGDYLCAYPVLSSASDRRAEMEGGNEKFARSADALDGRGRLERIRKRAPDSPSGTRFGDCVDDCVIEGDQSG